MDQWDQVVVHRQLDENFGRWNLLKSLCPKSFATFDDILVVFQQVNDRLCWSLAPEEWVIRQLKEEPGHCWSEFHNDWKCRDTPIVKVVVQQGNRPSHTNHHKWEAIVGWCTLKLGFELGQWFQHAQEKLQHIVLDKTEEPNKEFWSAEVLNLLSRM